MLITLDCEKKAGSFISIALTIHSVLNYKGCSLRACADLFPVDRET